MTTELELQMRLYDIAAVGCAAPPNDGPFRRTAMELRNKGLAVLPVAKDEKRPMVQGFTAWRGPPAMATVAKWLDRFADCNIGVSCGPSKLVVVDIDDGNLLDLVLTKIGSTPLIIETPSGGYHCYYADRIGLASMNLRNIGLAIDIKAKGGFVVAPPSYSAKRGRSYSIVRGDWSLLSQLPVADVDAISRLTGRAAGQGATASGQRPAGLIPVGHRNHYLFEHLRIAAPFASLESAIQEALHYNHTQNEAPEDDAAVMATARQVWNYQQSNKLKKPSAGYVRISHNEMDILGAAAGKDYPTTLALLAELRRSHGGADLLRRPFAVTAEAMTAAKVVPGVGDPKRITRARMILEQLGLLRCVMAARRTSAYLRKPALYLLGVIKAPVAPEEPAKRCDPDNDLA